MGLDMFLYRRGKPEEVAYWRKANAIHGWFERRLTEDYEDGIENCRDYLVSKEDLEELKSTCERVIAASKLVPGKVKNGDRLVNGVWEPLYEDGVTIQDASLAEELLPTQEGFFFGSKDYNEWYINDLEETIEQINNILETTDFDKQEIVYSAWW